MWAESEAKLTQCMLRCHLITVSMGFSLYFAASGTFLYDLISNSFLVHVAFSIA